VTLNHELFTKDPLRYTIPNDGVSKVGRPDDEKQWDVLRYELESFVCDGEYATGLQRILSSFATHVGEGDQPAAWVSGFFGSGKSHLVRVLEHLWADTRFPDGASARGLANLSRPVQDSLLELKSVAVRAGAQPWAAAGSLDTAHIDQLNAAFLAVVLGAAGLPDKIAPAGLALWLHDEGLYDDVAARIEAAGKDPVTELKVFHLSQALAAAVLEARPDLAESAAGLRQAFKAQFPDRTHISTGDTVEMLRRVLLRVGAGAVPPTLVVLDEVQQYVNDDADRAMAVQHLVEAVSKGFGGRVLIVATGQAELVGNPTLEKIKDRFSVQVHLKNQDVDVVVRRVLLSKEPARRGELQSTLDRAQGEIRRHLSGSKLQHQGADDETLVDDYPLLPNRRRLWEDVLRQAGRTGQLRSQLRVVQEANAKVARRGEGTVVGADFLFEFQQDAFNQTGRLLKEVQTLINDQLKEPDGDLRFRLLGLVFLVNQLPKDGANDRGVRTTQEHLADLLVEDLATDGAAMRQRVPVLLETLAREGVLQERDHEYFLQTKAGQEWTQDFERRRSSIAVDAVVVATERDKALRDAVKKVLPPFVMQDKQRRNLAVQFDDVEPQVIDTVPVWVRNGWSVKDKQFRDLARGAGQDSPLVFVYLPKVASDELTDALADQTAAQQVLDTRAAPTTDDGREARQAMVSRRDAAKRRVDRLVQDVLGQATVELAGGGIPEGKTLAEQVTAAAQRAVTRLYPQYGPAAHAGWANVVARLKQGSTEDVLRPVGHEGPVDQHDATKAVLALVGPSGTDARKVDDTLTGRPYGWGGDAIKGAIAALVASEHLTATVNGAPATAKSVATLTRLGGLHLRRESVVVTPVDQIRARKLIQALAPAGQQASKAPLAEQVRDVVASLVRRAGAISGDAPLPQVAVPPTVQSLTQGSGNALVLDALAAEAELTEFAENVASLEQRRAGRLRALDRARTLADSASALPSATTARERLAAFEQSRELLAADDQITTIERELTDAVRAGLTQLWQEYIDAYASTVAALEANPAWKSLDDARRSVLRRAHHLDALPPLDLPDTDAVLDAVRARPFTGWRDLCDALPARASAALTDAVHETQPRAVLVHTDGATLTSTAELDAYVDKLRSRLADQLAQHGTIVVKPS